MQHIKAVIFDLGAVLLNLDQERTLRAFQRLGADLHQINLESTLFTDFETGKLSPDAFREGIKSHIKKPILNQHIDLAWNAMLLDVPLRRLQLVEKLKKYFNVYLLSNTNSIHIESFHQYLKFEKLFEKWEELFDRQFLSYEMGLRKPDEQIYLSVTEQLNLAPEQCLFLDDNQKNIESARQVGLKTIHCKTPFEPATLYEIGRLVSMRF